MIQKPTPTVRITSPAGLVASIPALLGFAPEQSLVVIGMRVGAAGRRGVGGVVRADLPGDGEDAHAICQTVRRQMSNSDADAVYLVVVAERSTPSGSAAFAGLADRVPPHAGLVETLTGELHAGGIATHGAFWTSAISTGAAWSCYDGCSGTLPDPRTTETAAHLAVSGKVTYRSREEAVAALAPDPAARTAQRRALIDAAHQDAAAARARGRARAVRGDLEELRRAARTVGRGEPLAGADVARLLAALSDPGVRDVCIGFALGCDADVDPDLAEPLWTALTRAAPAPEVAQPATLLAFAALEHGGGAHLRIALDLAIDADPEHRLSRMLDALLGTGTSPAGVRTLVTDVVNEAAALISG